MSGKRAEENPMCWWVNLEARHTKDRVNTSVGYRSMSSTDLHPDILAWLRERKAEFYLQWSGHIVRGQRGPEIIDVPTIFFHDPDLAFEFKMRWI